MARDTLLLSHVLVSLDRSLELREVDVATAIEVDRADHRPDLLSRELDVQAGDHALELLVREVAVALFQRNIREQKRYLKDDLRAEKEA